MSTHFLTVILILTALFGFVGLILAFLPLKKLYAVINFFYQKLARKTLLSSLSHHKRTEPSLGTKSTGFSHKTGAQISSNGDHDGDANFTILYLLSLDEYYTGFKLWDALQKVKLHYGASRIFHFYDQSTQGSQVVFSVAGALEPGYLDIHQIKEMLVPGLCFFMQNQQEQPMRAFRNMLKTAQDLETLLGGVVCDAQRQTLTQKTIEAYQSRLHEFSVTQDNYGSHAS